MNRYAAAGLLSDVMQGRRILVLSGTHVERRIAHRVIVGVAQGLELPVSVIMVNGQESVRDPRSHGRVEFDVVDRSLFGRIARRSALGVVFIDHDGVQALRCAPRAELQSVWAALDAAEAVVEA